MTLRNTSSFSKKLCSVGGGNTFLKQERKRSSHTMAVLVWEEEKKTRLLSVTAFDIQPNRKTTN